MYVYLTYVWYIPYQRRRVIYLPYEYNVCRSRYVQRYYALYISLRLIHRVPWYECKLAFSHWQQAKPRESSYGGLCCVNGAVIKSPSHPLDSRHCQKRWSKYVRYARYKRVNQCRLFYCLEDRICHANANTPDGLKIRYPTCVL